MRWDLFCAVVDNLGDIGVCWRLARQLAAEHRAEVRLWVDDLTTFRQLAPELDVEAPSQKLGEIGRAARSLRLAVRHRGTSFLAAATLCAGAASVLYSPRPDLSAARLSS